MSSCPYITLDIVPLMQNQNSDYIEKYAEIISKLECNPNPYLKCGVGVMQYMKMYKQKVLTSGCLYYMNILAYIVDEISEKKSFKEIAQNVIKWAVCFIIDEVRKLLIFLLQKIINNSFLSKFAKVFYNPDAPYGFYIVITPIFSTHLRSKIYNFFYKIYFKLIKKRTQRRRWRIPKEKNGSKKKSKLNINDTFKSAKSTLGDLAEAAFKGIVDSILMAGDLLIDKAIKRYLGKIVKYDISGQYSNATPYSPYDRLTEGTFMIPDSANPVTFTNDFYYGLYSPSLFFAYSESAFAGVLESTIIGQAKEVLDFVNPIGSTAAKPPTGLKDKKKSRKERKEERKKRRKERKKAKKQAKKGSSLERSKLLSRYSKSSKKPAVLIFSSLSDMYSYYSLLMLDYEMGKSISKDKYTYDVNDNDAKTIISYYEDVIDTNAFILKDEKNYFIDKTSDLFNNSVSLLLYANSTYYFSDDFMFLSFTQKLSMHSPDSKTEYLTPYYAVRAPIYKMMAWHINDLSSEPSNDVYSIYMPYMLSLYLFNATNTDRGNEGINFEDFINYVDSYIISSAKNLVEAIELINRPVIEWYYDYLRYVMESKDNNAKIALKQISESIDYLSVNKPAYLAPVQHFVTEFREKYKKATSSTDQALASQEYAEAIELGHNIMRLLNMIMLPVEGKVKDGLTQLVDWQVHSENIVYETNLDSNKVDTTIHIGHRAAERQLMVDIMRGGNNDKDMEKIKSKVLSKLLNPVLAFIIQSKEILYNYFSHVDIGASTYAMVSLEPFSTYFDPLPARFTYDLFADPQMTNFLKRRGLDVFSAEDLENLYYHSSISIFTDLLPVKTLTVTYDDLETESIDYGGYKIDIPVKWNVYTPEIRLEIYDNAYRDLYNYFFKYMKIAFYKGAARPPLDISFILDIITINLDHSVQNLVSYIVVPKSIDMEYIEYDSSEVYTETKTINITFSVIGFIHYTDTIETVSNVTGKGGISFLAGSFVEADVDITQLDPVKKIYEYADTVITNWYGIYNAQPLYVLRNEQKSTTTITEYNHFSDGKAKAMTGMGHTYFTGNLYSLSKTHNSIYTINNTHSLPASHVYFKKKTK